MPTFQYEAMDSAGRQVTAEIHAGSSDEAIMHIRAQGYFPTKVRQVAGNSLLSSEPLQPAKSPVVQMTADPDADMETKPPAAKPPAFQSRTPWWFGALFAMVGLGVMAAGWILGVVQHYRLSTFQPVAAHVMDAHVNTIHGKHTSYEAVVTYSYTVHDQQYQSSHVYAIPGSSSSSSYHDADVICRQYPTGSSATAWISPTDPSSAFLLRDVSPTPYFLAFFSLPFFSSGVFLLLARFAGSRIPEPTVVDGGWFQLKEVGTIRRRFWLWLCLAVDWYIRGDSGSRLPDSERPEPIYHGPCGRRGCIVGVDSTLVRMALPGLMHDFHNAQVRINLNPIRIGNTLKVQIRQSLLHPLDVEEFSIGLVCIEDTRTKYGNKTSYSSDEACSVWKKLVAGRAFGLGEEVAGETALAMPQDASPSGAADRSSYPYYHWYIALYVKARGEPQLNAHFPVKMEA